MPKRLNKAVLHIDGELGSGEFHMRGSLEIAPSIRTGYVIGGRGSTVNAITGGDNRKGVFADLGGGATIVEISFRGWKGARDEDGSHLQWGDSADPTEHTKTSATGQGAVDQLECLLHWLEQTTIDSGNPATLEYGQHHPDGVYDPMQCVVEEPNLSKAAEDGSWFDGTLTFVSAVDIRERIDALGVNPV